MFSYLATPSRPPGILAAPRSSPVSAGYIAKVKAVQSANLIDFWTLNDASGTTAVDAINTARNGLYVNSPTLQAATFADGVNKAPAFVSASSQYVNVFSSSLAAAFNNAEGTLLCWLNPTAAAWADTAQHLGVLIGKDVNNLVIVRKNAVAKNLNWYYSGAGVAKQVNFTYGTAPTTWVPMVLTWSTTGNRMRAYLSGSQTGADQTPLPTWASAPIAGWCQIGAYNGPSLYMDGNIAMCALWTKELTAAEVLTVSTAP